MTNEEVLRNLPLKDFASLVIRHKYREDYDYDYNEDPVFWRYKTILITSDGEVFDEDNYLDALEHECWWLKQEATVCGKKEDSV